MLSTLFKKKLSDDRLANVFVNGVLDVIDKGFPEVINLIKEDPAFITPPPLVNAKDGHFAMIVIVGNMSFVGDHFEPQQAVSVEKEIERKFAEAYGMSLSDFKGYLKDYKGFISRANHPSKNMLYGMSKAVFHKYKLNDYQDDYFKSLVCPNPLFLKRMDEVMEHFIWNWDAFFKRYKMVS